MMGLPLGLWWSRLLVWDDDDRVCRGCGGVGEVVGGGRRLGDEVDELSSEGVEVQNHASLMVVLVVEVGDVEVGIAEYVVAR